MIFLCNFVTSKLADYHEQRRFCPKVGESCFINRRSPKYYIFLYPNMSGAWIQARMADDVGIQIQSQIANVRRTILRNGVKDTSTTATQSMDGTASFFSHLFYLNKEVSSVSFKFKSARYSKHADSKCAKQSTDVFDGCQFARFR